MVTMFGKELSYIANAGMWPLMIIFGVIWSKPPGFFPDKIVFNYFSLEETQLWCVVSGSLRIKTVALMY